MDWIDTEKELPPCDGFYEVTNNADASYDIYILNYDGVGFKSLNSYSFIRWWRHIQPVIKRYGKIVPDDQKDEKIANQITQLLKYAKSLERY